MRTLLILSIICSLAAYAEDFQRQIWMKGSDYYVFTYHASTNMLISENCFNPKVTLEQSKCDAAKIFKEKKTYKIPAGAAKGGKNPGAVICKDVLKKQIRILKNHKDDENSFCVFDDGSMVSAIGLETILKE
ncbi:hypothetical protein ACJVC5_11445 [Peredibacter sp. HCB2-198]|uniref:hypothetical protein n=1 Tax=Peredibacter sp. HCB2-198 TaxID=3383025 RepID=UPI0038B5584C